MIFHFFEKNILGFLVKKCWFFLPSFFSHPFILSIKTAVKNSKNIWKSETFQVLVITTSLYCLAPLLLDFRTSLFPNYYHTANINYLYFLRGLCCFILGFGLLQFLRNSDDYFTHMIHILNHPNRWIYYSIRIILIALFFKCALNALFPYSSGYERIYFIMWLSLNATIVLPMVVIITKYRM